jgi:hypothetical protein
MSNGSSNPDGSAQGGGSGLSGGVPDQSGSPDAGLSDAQQDANTCFGPGPVAGVVPVPCPPPPGNLLVTVEDAKDGTPIQGAEIQVKGPEPQSGTTDSTGQASFSSVTPGQYNVTARKDGYAANPALPRVFFGSASGSVSFSTGGASANAPSGGTGKADFRFQKLSATVELLVGGPYGNHPYGHVAVRVVNAASDTTYDFGRYGRTWGTGNSQGEGMLRVWTDFGKYIADENSTGRTTTGYIFRITPAEAQKIDSFLSAKISGLTTNQDRGYMKQYRLPTDYDALTCNCTTLSVDGTKQALPNIDDNYSSYNSGRGLSLLEKGAAKVAGWPNRTFMPADLGALLSSMDGQDKPTSESFSASQ